MTIGKVDKDLKAWVQLSRGKQNNKLKPEGAPMSEHRNV